MPVARNRAALFLLVLTFATSGHNRALAVKNGRAELSSPQMEGGQLPLLEQPIRELLRKDFERDPARRHVVDMFEPKISYDYNAHLSTSALVERLNLEPKVYNVTSDDGYVTQLVRIVNRHVARELRKHIPVVLYAGQGISPGAFLVSAINKLASASSPDAEHDHLDWKSRNRSLAFALSQRGYDVWLVPARGVDRENSARVAPTKSLAKGDSNPLDLLKNFLPNVYWTFSQDQLISFEFKRQLEVVLRESNSEKVSLLTYSSGAFVAFAFLSGEREFAHRHVDSVISLAPVVFANKFNLLLGAANLFSSLTLPYFPYPEDHVDSVARGAVVAVCKSKLVRYTVCKFLLDSLYGQSEQFQTFIELGLLDYIGKPQSSLALRQVMQASYWGQLRKFDFGPVANTLEYGSISAPDYKLGELSLPHVYLVSGERDAIADKDSVAKLATSLGKHPQLVEVRNYNHLDMIAGWDVSVKVNAPVLHILDDRHLELFYYKDEGGDGGDGAHDEQHKDGDGETETGGEGASEQPDESGHDAAADGARSLSLARARQIAPPPAKLRGGSRVVPNVRQTTLAQKQEREPRKAEPLARPPAAKP